MGSELSTVTSLDTAVSVGLGGWWGFWGVRCSKATARGRPTRPPASRRSQAGGCALLLPRLRLARLAGCGGLNATAATAPQTAGDERGALTHMGGRIQRLDRRRALEEHDRFLHTGALGGSLSTAETAALRRHSTGPERRQHGQPAQATSHPCGACHSEHREIPDPADHDGRTAQPPTGPPSPPPPTRAPAKSPTKTPRQLSAA